MKHFIKQLFYFISIIFVIQVLLIMGTSVIVSSVSFRIPDDKNIIIVGDSHTECAIDDSIFLRAINVSQSGVAYLYSYVKLKKILNTNPHIDKVLLSFHGSSIIKAADEWVTGNSKIMAFVPHYFPLFSKDEIFFLIKKPMFLITISSLAIDSYRTIMNIILKKNVTYKDLHIGGYLKLDNDKLKEDIKSRNDDITEMQVKYSQYQFEYLLKIVELCREKNLELILFSSPTYDSERYGNKSDLINYYNTYLEGIKYLDFSDFVLPEYGYSDIDHLNYKGAEIFSRYLEDNYEIIFEK